jgi:hypothetical protein
LFVRFARFGYAGANVIEKGNDATGFQVDVEIHYFLGRGALGEFVAIDFVCEMKALVVGAHDLRSNSDKVIKVQFAKVENVGFRCENAVLGALDIILSQIERVAGRIISPVEHDAIKGDVHVAVCVDPIREHTAAVFFERAGEVFPRFDHGRPVLAKQCRADLHRVLKDWRKCPKEKLWPSRMEQLDG